MIDVSKLIVELDSVTEWGKVDEQPGRLRELCRRSALALREAQESKLQLAKGFEEMGKMMLIVGGQLRK